MLLIAIPLSCWQIKLLPYATYLAVPLIAVWLARPSGTEDASRSAAARCYRYRSSCYSSLDWRRGSH